jgi:hypothetical protein
LSLHVLVVCRAERERESRAAEQRSAIEAVRENSTSSDALASFLSIERCLLFVVLGLLFVVCDRQAKRAELLARHTAAGLFAPPPLVVAVDAATATTATTATTTATTTTTTPTTTTPTTTAIGSDVESLEWAPSEASGMCRITLPARVHSFAAMRRESLNCTTVDLIFRRIAGACARSDGASTAGISDDSRSTKSTNLCAHFFFVFPGVCSFFVLVLFFF